MLDAGQPLADGHESKANVAERDPRIGQVHGTRMSALRGGLRFDTHGANGRVQWFLRTVSPRSAAHVSRWPACWLIMGRPSLAHGKCAHCGESANIQQGYCLRIGMIAIDFHGGLRVCPALRMGAPRVREMSSMRNHPTIRLGISHLRTLDNPRPSNRASRSRRDPLHRNLRPNAGQSSRRWMAERPWDGRLPR